MWYSEFTTNHQTQQGGLLMNRITQEAHKRQAVVKLAKRKGQSYASRMYGVSLSSVKRWLKRYDGTWQSLREKSHRPKSHPQRHTAHEEQLIRAAMDESFFRYGWEGAYMTARDKGYTRSYSGFIYAARRMGLCGGKQRKSHPASTIAVIRNFWFPVKKCR